MNPHSLFGIWRNAEGDNAYVSNAYDVFYGCVRIKFSPSSPVSNLMNADAAHAFLINGGYLHIAH